jgi:hypothetical protein
MIFIVAPSPCVSSLICIPPDGGIRSSNCENAGANDFQVEDDFQLLSPVGDFQILPTTSVFFIG